MGTSVIGLVESFGKLRASLEDGGISCHGFIKGFWEPLAWISWRGLGSPLIDLLEGFEDLLLWVYYRGLGSFVFDIPHGLGGFLSQIY